MSLRILLASDYYPPYIGGAHRQTQLLGQELHARGHKVAVATAWQPNVPEVEDEAGVRIYRLKQLRSLGPGGAQDRQQRHQPPFPDPVTVLALRRLIRRFRPIPGFGRPFNLPAAEPGEVVFMTRKGLLSCLDEGS